MTVTYSNILEDTVIVIAGYLHQYMVMQFSVIRKDNKISPAWFMTELIIITIH